MQKRGAFFVQKGGGNEKYTEKDQQAPDGHEAAGHCIQDKYSAILFREPGEAMHKADFMGRSPEPGWRDFLQQNKAAEIPGREMEGSE